VFNRVFQAAVSRKAKPNERDAAAHLLARLGPGIVPPERFTEMAGIACDSTRAPSLRADVLEAISHFCLHEIREPARDGVAYLPEDLWRRYFGSGQELQGIPPEARAKTVAALETLLDDKELGPRAAVALVFLSSRKQYQPPESVVEKIVRNVGAGYGVIDPHERYFTDVALALLARDGKVASPPRFLVDLSLSRLQPYSVRAGVLRPLGAAITRYENARKRNGGGVPPDHDALVAELRRLVDDDHMQASKHPVLADLRKYVEAQEAEKKKRDEDEKRPTEGGLVHLPRG
jgi:hypothetical protein